MGLLSEFNQLAKAGRIEQLNAYLGENHALNRKDCTAIANHMDPNHDRIASAYRRTTQHNLEISIASIN